MDLTACEYCEDVYEWATPIFVVPRISHLFHQIWVTVPKDVDPLSTFVLELGGCMIFKTSIANLSLDQTCLKMLFPTKDNIIVTDTHISINMLAFHDGFFPLIAIPWHSLKVIVHGPATYTVKLTSWRAKRDDHALSDKIVRFFNGNMILPMLGWKSNESRALGEIDENHGWYNKKHHYISAYVLPVMKGDVSTITHLIINGVTYPVEQVYNQELKAFFITTNVLNNLRVECVPLNNTIIVTLRKLLQKRLIVAEGLGWVSPCEN